MYNNCNKNSYNKERFSMVYQYNSRIHLAEVVLNVKDLESQTAFYHQLLGLEILNQSGIRKERFSLL